MRIIIIWLLTVQYSTALCALTAAYGISPLPKGYENVFGGRESVRMWDHATHTHSTSSCGRTGSHTLI